MQVKSRYHVLPVVLLMVAGCATTATQVPTYTPKFGYTVPSTAAPSASATTFALVQPEYASLTDDWRKTDLMTRFRTNMAADLQTALNARGYNLRGPFPSLDEMTFPDKKGSDLALVPDLQVEINTQAISQEAKLSLGGALLASSPKIEITYLSTLRGKVSLQMIEPLSKERMWSRSIDVPETVVKWSAVQSEGMSQNTWAELNSAFGKALEQIYSQMLDTAWKYLDPGEVDLVVKQAQEIRKNKVY